jgi:hypothetical protein
MAGFTPMTEVTNTSQVDPTLVAARLEKNVRLSLAALALKGTRYAFVLQPALAVTSKTLSAREQKLRANELPPVLDILTKSYQEIRTHVSSIHDDRFLYLDESDAFAGLGSTEEIFLDSYHFGDRGNGIVAGKIADGIRSMLGDQVR